MPKNETVSDFAYGILFGTFVLEVIIELRRQVCLYCVWQSWADGSFCGAILPFLLRILLCGVLRNYLPLNLLYITLIFIGSCGLFLPPTSRVLVSDISCVSLMIEAVPPLDVLEYPGVTGTNTTLFQSSLALPAIFSLCIMFTIPEMLLKV